jgi:hypothetical protein
MGNEGEWEEMCGDGSWSSYGITAPDEVLL